MGKRTTPATTLPLSRSLPGLHMPLNYSPHDLFPSPLDDSKLEDGYCSLPITTLRELAMLQIMNSLTDKPGWEVKVFDDAIAEKWKQEAISTKDADVTEKMMDYVIAELRWKASFFNKTGAVIVYNGDVVKSDSAIPADLKAALRAAVQPLEDIPNVHKDYHPGSDGQVLDLVHPSLFPLIYGRSRVLEDRAIGLEDCIDHIGEGKTIEIRDEDETTLAKRNSYSQINSNQNPYSKHFQWLPCDIDISNGEARIVSYINNLHPHKHQYLYSVIGQIITKTLPLWNMTLSGPSKSYKTQRITFECKFDPDPEDIAEEDRPPQNEGEEEDDYWDRIQEWEDEVRKTVMPEPEEFSSPMDDYDPAFELATNTSGSGLQVIVKLANIELSSEKPEYAGGTWHVEGQLNEHICATALYYYDNENITDSHLAFRQHVDRHEMEEMNYPQNIHGWLTDVFGCENEGPTIQEVGTIFCKEDRLLTFPNILQHQVQPFKLADPSKPGHRKILALFLVDPNIRIISTANVPPQQREWWSEKVSEAFASTEVALGVLSNELKDKVFAEVDDFPIGMGEAKEIRLELMEERKKYVIAQDQSFNRSEFGLCEH